VLALATALAGCAGFTGNPAHQVAEWANGASLSTNDGYIVADVKDIDQGIASRQLIATHTACDGLGTDAGTAYGELPTPDSELTNELNNAYLDFTNAAQKCSDARSFAGTGFAAYEREIARAESAFNAANRRLHHFGIG